MVELADTPDLGSGAARYVGSSPILGKFLFYPIKERVNLLTHVRVLSFFPQSPAKYALFPL